MEEFKAGDFTIQTYLQPLIDYVNRLLELCIKDGKKLKFVIQMNIRADLTYIPKIYISENYIYENKLPISKIYTYITINKNKIYYRLDSETKKGYEGKGYNQLLRAIFIISASFIFVDEKKIDYVGSNVVNPVSGYIWREKFHFKPMGKMQIKITKKKIGKLVGRNKDVGFLSLKEQEKMLYFNKILEELNIPDTRDPDIYFFDDTSILTELGSQYLIDKGWKELIDWNFDVSIDRESGMN